MTTDTEHCSFAGYVVVQDVPYQPYFGGPLPAVVTSISSCQTASIPDVSWLSWGNVTAEQRESARRAFELSEERATELTTVVDRLFAENEICWPRYLQSDEAVRAILALLPSTARFRVIGVAMHESLVAELVELVADVPSAARSLVAAIETRRPLPPGGTTLGFEPLCTDYDGTPSCSWLCNGLIAPFVARCQSTPNANGLVDDFASADAFCRIVADEELGEPGLWLPWLLVDYTAHLRLPLR